MEVNPVPTSLTEALQVVEEQATVVANGVIVSLTEIGAGIAAVWARPTLKGNPSFRYTIHKCVKA